MLLTGATCGLLFLISHFLELRINILEIKKALISLTDATRLQFNFSKCIVLHDVSALVRFHKFSLNLYNAHLCFQRKATPITVFYTGLEGLISLEIFFI